MEGSLSRAINTRGWNSVQKNAFEIADDVVKFMIGKSVGPPSSRYSKAMRRAVNEISQKHELLFKEMTAKLDITRENANTVLPTVLDEVFADGMYNWGRLVTVYAFSGWVARHITHNKTSDAGAVIAKTTGQYVADKLTPWIENNGGWDGFEAFFKEPEPLNPLSGLFSMIVGISVGALASALTVK